MKEIQDILRECEQTPNSHNNMAMATLVKVEGSTYRRVGARMLILPDGRRIGALSGGCLESDVAERAKNVIATGEPCLVQYNAKTGFDVVNEMGCRGALSILVERVSRPECAVALQFLTDCIVQRRSGVLATVFHVEDCPGIEIGQRLTWTPPGLLAFLPHPAHSEVSKSIISHPDLRVALMQDVAETALTKQSQVKSYALPDGIAEVLIEFVPPPISLCIFGAGDDAIPLADFASLLGWQTTVADNRASYASADRFPKADRLLTSLPDDALRGVPLDERSAVVIMSHNYEQDRIVLSRLVSADAPYIGILGPVKRTERLLNDIRATGTIVAEDSLARLHSPAGLDIGSETPEEIALSIIAEIQATFTRTAGGSLRNRAASYSQPIHSDS